MSGTPNNPSSSDIIFYRTPQGAFTIEVLYASETFWLTQKKLAELFGVDRTVVTKHLKNIFSTQELNEASVCANFAHTAEDGNKNKSQSRHAQLERI